MLNHLAGRALIAHAPKSQPSFHSLRRHYEKGQSLGFALLDCEGNTIQRNEAFQRLLGPVACGFPHSLYEREPGLAKVLARRLRILFERGRAMKPIIAHLPNGARLRISLEPVIGPGAVVWGAACVVSEMRKSSLELVRTPEPTLATANHPADHRVFAELSHDLRSPLTVAKMAAQILGDEESFGAGLRGRFLNRLITALDRMDLMIRETLNQHRRQTLSTLSVRTDVASEVEACTKQLSFLYPERVRYEVKGGHPFPIFIDRTVVWRITENLVHNAAHHGQEGGRITVAVQEADERIAITVHNFGEIIDGADAAGIFASYRRERKPEGWGLGLAIVRRLASENGGELTLSSDPSTGTFFRLSLPAAR